MEGGGEGWLQSSSSQARPVKRISQTYNSWSEDCPGWPWLVAVAAVLSKCDIKTTCGSAASHRCCFAATNNYNSTNESLKLFMNLGNFRGFCPANIFYISAGSSQAPAWTPGVIDLCKTWPGVETIFLTLSLVFVNKLLTRVAGDL